MRATIVLPRRDQTEMHGSRARPIEKYNPKTMDRHRKGGGAMQRPQGWRRPRCSGESQRRNRDRCRRPTKNPARSPARAHFVSFNFTNALIRTLGSRTNVRGVRRCRDTNAVVEGRISRRRNPPLGGEDGGLRCANPPYALHATACGTRSRIALRFIRATVAQRNGRELTG
jgi:hypothetical protein